MELRPDSATAVMAVDGNERPMANLIETLIARGIQVDVAKDRSEALQTFFAAGGHQLLLLGPELAPGTAWRIFRALREVDPELRAVAFGERLARSGPPSGVLTLASFHPSSRAALGAVLRSLST